MTLEQINVTEAKAHLNRYVRDIDTFGDGIIVANERTKQAILMLSAHAWQVEIENLLHKCHRAA